MHFVHFFAAGLCAITTAACIAGADVGDDAVDDAQTVAQEEAMTTAAAEQGLALEPETANDLNYCCFKCTGWGKSGLFKVFGGHHCQIVANNHCQAWGVGTGYQAHQCTQDGWATAIPADSVTIDDAAAASDPAVGRPAIGHLSSE